MKILSTTLPGTLIRNIKTGKVYKMWGKPYVSGGCEYVCYKAIGVDGQVKGPIITSKVENMAIVTRPA